MKRKLALSAVLIAGGFAFSSSAMAETPSAAMLGYTCAGCHGTNGNSNGPATPSLAGASKDYIIEVMEYYASGERASTIMGRIAKGYTKDEIKAMAEFFSKQKFVPAKGQKFDAKLAKKGAKLHDKYCEKCHAEGGTSSEDDAGILAGQWTPYLKYTLADMQAGKSHVPKKMKKKMKKMKEKTGDAGIEQLLNYYASKK
ncbi:MAG TPA: cytochrome c4 [Thiolapillus brandeum]|uniref:Cytochrome c4 n=1 Tax=Thiolapillus brandeum TaxID=1076588 RepID=A0A831NYC3_9GAMM|nr:cytochrome c4 [Thiolapillus brandeum]